MRPYLLAALFLLLTATLAAAPQQDAQPQPYDDPDAYRVYSALLPQEESYAFAKGTLVLQLESIPPGDSTSACLTLDAAAKFKDAIADFARASEKTWQLQRRFEIETPYEIVSHDTILAVSKEGGWKLFDRRYPNSGGYIVMSAVGFNKGKTQAITYMGSACGSLCGSWRLHLLEKIKGKWRTVPGVQCVTVS